MMNLAIEAVVLVAGFVAFMMVPLSRPLVYGALVFLTILTYLLSRQKGYSLADLGLVNNFKKTTAPWLTGTLFLLLLLAVAVYYSPGGIVGGVWTNRNSLTYTIPLYVTIGSFIQEFVFRGYYFARVRSYLNDATAIVLNIIIFTLFHLPILSIQPKLFFLSILGGVFWSISYAKYPNLYLAWLSHAILGSTVLIIALKLS